MVIHKNGEYLANLANKFSQNLFLSAGKSVWKVFLHVTICERLQVYIEVTRHTFLSEKLHHEGCYLLHRLSWLGTGALLSSCK
jgi:hypothetical protein